MLGPVAACPGLRALPGVERLMPDVVAIRLKTFALQPWQWLESLKAARAVKCGFCEGEIPRDTPHLGISALGFQQRVEHKRACDSCAKAIMPALEKGTHERMHSLVREQTRLNPPSIPAAPAAEV